MQSKADLELHGITQAQVADELERFLSAYGEVEAPQSADAADTDTQIKNLSLLLAQAISATPSGTVLDIGAGNGILLQRLSDLDAFVQSPGWTYAAADFEESAEAILKLATHLRLHRRVEVLTLEDLHSTWVPRTCPSTVTVIIRNVMHELDIVHTSTLLTTLTNRLQPADTVIIQDLLVMHTAERGNACWTTDCFAEVLQHLGFKFSFVVEPTTRGSRWFTFVCSLPVNPLLTIDQVQDIVCRARFKQFLVWKELGSLVESDNRVRQVALIDFDLQLAALQMQLFAVNADSVRPLTSEQQYVVSHATFTKHLAAFDVPAFVRTIVPIDRPPNFRDRAHNQDALEAFLLDASSLVLVVGGPFMGKTHLVQEVLARRAHDRQPVFIDAQATTGVWNMVEQYLVGIGCIVPYDLLATFQHLTFSSLEEPLKSLVDRVSRNTVVCFDHFERSLDPNLVISDGDIQRFLSILVQGPSAKVIVTTRRDPAITFLPSEIRVNVQQPTLGRFPHGEHVENVLDDFVNRAAFGITEYPEELLLAIDRFPYLAALAGRVIRAESGRSLQEPRFLSLVRKRLRDALLYRIVTPEARPAIELGRVLRIPVPRRMFEALAGQAAVKAAEELGLVYSTRDRLAGELLTGPEILRGDFERDGDHEDIAQAQDRRGRRQHVQAAHWYERLYREERDPRWLRESYYHTTAHGDPERLQRFGVMYRDELFAAGEYWFQDDKDFKSALVAFQAARNLGLKTYLCRMRIAGCLMRVGDRKAGEDLYRQLIVEYPSNSGPKTSYVDSLLYCRDFTGALKALQSFSFSVEDDPWIAHEFGRAYLGIHRYADAVRAFEYQLSVAPKPIAYHMLARAYLRLGERDEVTRVLEDGLAGYHDDNYLKLDYAAHLIRLGHIEPGCDAESLLASLPQDGRVLQQLVKLLCAQDRADEAVQLLNDRDWRIRPDRYKTPIQVEIYIAKQQFEYALSLLRNILSDDEHLVGLKKKVYLRWAGSARSVGERKRIAKEGLSVPLDAALRRNIPIMVTSARLALLAEDRAQFEELLSEISALNAQVARLLRDEEDEEIGYWEEVAFDS
jgi:tetratricopeptide (TPR) repeat protein